MVTSCQGKIEPVAGTLRTSSRLTTGVVVMVSAATAALWSPPAAAPSAPTSPEASPRPQPVASTVAAQIAGNRNLRAMRIRMEVDGYWHMGGGNLSDIR